MCCARRARRHGVHAIGWTPLHFAAFGGNLAAVRLLLDHGAAIEQPAANKFANTPLHVALLTAARPRSRSPCGTSIRKPPRCCGSSARRAESWLTPRSRRTDQLHRADLRGRAVGKDV